MKEIKEKEFQKNIDKCKKNINEVFKLYEELTKGIVSWENMIKYQNILIETLYEEKKIEDILKKNLKEHRRNNDNDNEKMVLKKLEKLENIEQSIKILGDFLCWIFYRNDCDLIENHLDKQPIGMHSIGSGVIAEIETIKMLNKPENLQFYLYNELSSFLRVGDISVFDKVLGKIVGFGEIKSSVPKNNKMQVSIDFIVNNNSKYIPNNIEYQENQNHDFLDEKMLEHLEKQIQSMKDTLVNKKTFDKKINQEVNIPHYSNLEKLINKCAKNGLATIKVSNDIIYLAIRNDYDMVKFEENFDKEGILKEYASKINKGQNVINYSNLNLLSYGINIPFLLFPISNQSKKKALHQTIFIIFSYNTIVTYFCKKGFKVVTKKKVMYLEKEINNLKISICLESINELYLKMLLDENASIEIIEKTIKESKKDFNGGEQQIYVNIKHNSYRSI